jgi:hypothetical protein
MGPTQLREVFGDGVDVAMNAIALESERVYDSKIKVFLFLFFV